MPLRYPALLTALLLVRTPATLAQAGTLDPTFGDGGRVTLNVGGSHSTTANALAVQSDGKLVVAGSASNGSTTAFLIVRYSQGGALDPSFGAGGYVRTPIGTNGSFMAIHVLPDGRLLATGTTTVDGRRALAAVRYGTGGELDPTFGTGGIAQVRLDAVSLSLGEAAVDPEGRIVLVGYTFGEGDLVLARLLPDGQPDPHFGSEGDGVVVADVGGDDSAGAVAVQPDGRIVVVGWTRDRDGPLMLLVARFTAGGALDPSFGAGGVVRSPTAGSGRAVALQPDGKIVVGGSTQRDMAVARLNADGSFDGGFGVGGVATVRFADYASAKAVAVGPDGRIVAVGHDGVNSQFVVAAARLHPDGSLDPSFDGDGRVTTAVRPYAEDRANDAVLLEGGGIAVAAISTTRVFGESSTALAVVRYTDAGALNGAFGVGGVARMSGFGPGPDHARAVGVQPDGAVVVAGYARVGTTWDFALTRFLPDGAPDPAFGAGGVVTTPVRPGEDDRAFALALQPDGKVVVGGDTYRAPTYDYDFAVVRYNADGSLDPSWGGDGIVTTSFTSDSDHAFALVLQPDGKVVLAGHRFDFSGGSGGWRIALARYRPDGDLDPSFGTGGRALGPAGFAYGAALQADGKIIVAGFSGGGADGTLDVTLTRFHASGALDAAFGSEGTARTAIGSGHDYAYAVAMQPDGRIVVAGRADSDSSSTFALARFDSDGGLDPTFGSGGIVRTAVGAGYDVAWAVAVQRDGKIVAGGETVGSDLTRDFAVVRYLPDGQLDEGFGTGGLATVAFGAGGDRTMALALQPDGRLIAAGVGETSDGPDLALARLLTELESPAEGGPAGAYPDALSDARPNPSRGVSTILLTLAHERRRVVVDIVDVLGRRVGVLHEKPLAAGDHVLELDVGRLAPGMYVVRVSGDGLALGRTVTVAR